MNPENVTKNNIVDSVKAVIVEVNHFKDLTSTRHMELMNNMVNSINSLKKEIVNGFDKVEQNSIIQTDLLKQLVENTKK